jgi:hypothetical protein
VDRIADALSSGGGNLVYSGYPYDPFAYDSALPKR